MCMGVGLLTGVWATYHGPHERKWTLPLPYPLTSARSSWTILLFLLEGLLAWSPAYRSWVDNTSFCVFKSGTVLSCIEDTAWLWSSLTSVPCEISTPSSLRVPKTQFLPFLPLSVSMCICNKELQLSTIPWSLFYFLVCILSGYLNSLYDVPWFHTQWVTDHFWVLTSTFNEHWHSLPVTCSCSWLYSSVIEVIGVSVM